STSWRLTRPLRMLATGSPKLTKYGRRLANSLWPRKILPADRRTGPPGGKEPVSAGLPDGEELQGLIRTAADRAADYPAVPNPGTQFEGAFLQPYFSSAGFSGPPALTYLTLRDAGWPVYATRAEAEEIAETIRTSDLFDPAGYATRAGNIGTLDPALHYVIV